MPNVVTAFTRRRKTTAPHPYPHPRHRREGHFDEHDQWHDSSEKTGPKAHSGS